MKISNEVIICISMSQNYSLPLRYLTRRPVLFVCVCLFPKSDNSGCRVFPEVRREISDG